MKILGIETSCDETAVAVLEVNPPSHKASEGHLGQIRVVSNTISSQVKLHAKYGGVVPNLAAREHVKNIGHVFQLALKEAGIKNFQKKINLIAVTHGPGLGPSLLVGIAFARTLAWKYGKPLVGVNHLEGHIYSNWLQPVAVISKQAQNSNLKTQNIFPVLNLIVSGGHTELVLMRDHGDYKIIGETLDDAVGEAFDKVARLLGLGYPGGPAIDARAAKLKIKNEKLKITFPRPMINLKNFNFSYAGLKTAVLYKVRDLKSAGIKMTEKVINEICYEFQNAALDVLVSKTAKAAQEYKVKSLLLSGGVSANKELRERLRAKSLELRINYSQPEMEYTGDNAAMIAVAGYYNYKYNKKLKTSWDKVEMDANLGFRN